MNTQTLPPPTAAPRPGRRPKAAPPAQMSLMDLEPDAAPVPPSAPTVPRPKQAPAVATAPKPKAARTVKAPAPKTPTRVVVNADKKPPAAEPVRVVPETLLTSGAVWKMSGKHGVAYVKDAALAGELLATDPKHLAKAAMAVYYDKKGKAFAWQVRFDTDRWDEVMKRLA